MRLLAQLTALGLACLAGMPPAAEAVPAKIVILRHGEKQNRFRLCRVGEERAQALAVQYLGKGATPTLFPDDAPGAFVAITAHTLELIAPAAASWQLPITAFAVPPRPPHEKKKKKALAALTRRTQEAARDLMTNPRWQGQIVVVSWEHHHIADAALEQRFPGEEVTLRQLLNLDQLPDVPTTWPGSNYDYFWIVEYGTSDVPTRFTSMKQVFTPPYQDLPANDWGAPEQLPPDSKCRS